MSDVDWTELYRPDTPIGVDHLGMRLAGETAYTRLIDFTTTVSWRPRYFSFLCWNLEKAFTETPKRRRAEVEEIDAQAWRAAVKKRDYALAAATLAQAGDPGVVAGSIKIRRALAQAERSAEPLGISSDHLGAATGSLAIYAGPMAQLGLVYDSQGVSRTTQRGHRLATAFESSLESTGLTSVFEQPSVDLATLSRLGEVCGVAQLDSVPTAATVRERDELRETILEWPAFGSGRGPSARRVFSIGMLLQLNKALGGDAELDEFRAAILLHSARRSHQSTPWGLPAAYGEVLKEWRLYQAHAYVTYGLEAILSLILEAAFQRGGRSEGVPVASLVQGLLGALPAGFAASTARVASDGWHERTVSQCETELRVVVRAGGLAPIAEPELYGALAGNLRGGRPTDLAREFHDAACLLLLGISRLAHFWSTDSASWLGDTDPSRLPPHVLVDAYRSGISSGLTACAFLQSAVQEWVIRQHRRNALRKLAADPTKYTARFLLEGGRLVPLMPHEAGTSNPRFNNAVQYLKDLGWLTDTSPVIPTADGEELLQRISTEGTA